MPRRSRPNIGRSTRDANRKRLRRNDETEEERKIRLSNRRESNYLRRNRETSVEREIRLSLDRDRHRAQRARESSMDKYRSQKVRELSERRSMRALNYNSSIEYKNDPVVFIDPMSVVCEYCSALKVKDESKGLCCLQGKIKLEEILPPPDPLHCLLTGDHPKSKLHPCEAGEDR